MSDDYNPLSPLALPWIMAAGVSRASERYYLGNEMTKPIATACGTIARVHERTASFFGESSRAHLLVASETQFRRLRSSAPPPRLTIVGGGRS